MVGQQVAFGQRQGFSRDFTFVTAGFEADRAYVYTNGFVALGVRPADDFDAFTGPLADRPRPAVPVILPLHADLGGACPDLAADEAATFNRVEFAVEDDDLIIIWRAMLPAGGDRCPFLWDPAGVDSDRDGIGDACDLAPKDHCQDALRCRGEVDSDADGIPDVVDVCPTVPDPTQTDSDGDGIGNPCDGDCNGDGRWDIYQPAVQVGCMALIDADFEVEAASFPAYTPAD